MKNFLDEISEIDVEGATEIADGSMFDTHRFEPTASVEEDSEVDTEYDQTSVLSLEQSDADATAVTEAIDGRFRLLGVLGEGGMGKVYRGIQLSINRDVAIKVVREEFAHEPQLRARFEREAQLISSFNHPNIVRLVDFGESDGRLFLVMEFVNGKPISELFGGKQIHPKYVLEMGRQIASALTEAHAKGVVHRDLKPDNVLVSRVTDGTVQFKVLDFGVARTGSSKLTAAGAVCGTPEYMPPEQARGMTVGPESDLYAVGVMMYELLCGRVPFQGANAMAIMIKQVKELPPRVRDLAPHVPDDVEELIMALMEKEPADRINSAMMLCDTIDHIMSVHGWNQVIRVEDGPLNRTVSNWVYDGSPMDSGLRSGPHFGLSPNTSQDLKAPLTPTMGKAVGNPAGNLMDASFAENSSPILIDEDALASNRPQSRNAQVAERHAHEASAGAPQVRQPSPPDYGRPEREPPQRTESRPRTQTLPPRGAKPSKNNMLLMAALVLLLIAGLVIAMLIIQRQSGPSINPEELGTGSTRAILTQLSTEGWRPSPVVSSMMGGVEIQTSRVLSDTGQVSLTVYTCQKSEECKDVFDGIYLPRFGYTWTNHVVALEPSGDVPRVDLERILGTVQRLNPGGEASATGIR